MRYCKDLKLSLPHLLSGKEIGIELTGLTQNPDLFRQHLHLTQVQVSSLIRANLFKIREDWRRLADEKIILRTS
jgi:hypothetical protein